jgi:hypothetical protein
LHLNLPLVLLGGPLLPLQGSPWQAGGGLNDPEPQNAELAVLTAFDRYDVVTLGEAHRNPNLHDFAGRAGQGHLAWAVRRWGPRGEAPRLEELAEAFSTLPGCFG